MTLFSSLSPGIFITIGNPVPRQPLTAGETGGWGERLLQRLGNCFNDCFLDFSSYIVLFAIEIIDWLQYRFDLGRAIGASAPAMYITQICSRPFIGIEQWAHTFLAPPLVYWSVNYDFASHKTLREISRTKRRICHRSFVEIKLTDKNIQQYG